MKHTRKILTFAALVGTLIVSPIFGFEADNKLVVDDLINPDEIGLPPAVKGLVIFQDFVSGEDGNPVRGATVIINIPRVAEFRAFTNPAGHYLIIPGVLSRGKAYGKAGKFNVGKDTEEFIVKKGVNQVNFILTSSDREIRILDQSPGKTN